MDRRNFIKNTAICSTALCLGCAVYNKNKSIKPDSVVLDISTICQLKCKQCWRVTTPNRMPLGWTSFKDFKTFLDKNPFVKNIELSSSGEIFLNPDLNKMINYAKKKNVHLAAQTGVNLNTISDETAELLVTSKFGKLTISIDGASQEIYSIYRRGGDFNKVIENIKKIQYYQKKYNDFEHPKLVWKFIVFGHNEHEIPKAKQMAKELNIPIWFDINWAVKYSPIKDYDFVIKETGLDLRLLKSQTNDDYYKIVYDKYIRHKTDWFYCVSVFREPVIFFDGKFAGCCMQDYKNVPNVNVFKLGLEKTMKTKEVKELLDVIALRKSDKNTMCENCITLQFLKAHNYKNKITPEQDKKIKKL